MSVIIGIDPHKALHAACAIDRTENRLAALNVRSGARQVSQLLEWASPFACRTWAIESAGGLGCLLAQQLAARGEHVVDVPATLSSRVRLLGSGRSNKNDANDANDARAVAVAALRSPSLQDVRGEDHVSVLRLLAKAHLDTSRAREPCSSRLHALVNELVAGGIRREVVVNQAEQLLSTIVPVTATQRQRLQLAHELLDDIRLLDIKSKRSKQRITDAIAASGTTLTDIYGIGPIIGFASGQCGASDQKGQVIYCRGEVDSIDGGCVDLVIELVSTPTWRITEVRYWGFPSDQWQIDFDAEANLADQVAGLARTLPITLA